MYHGQQKGLHGGLARTNFIVGVDGERDNSGGAVGKFWTDAEYGHRSEGEIGIVRGVGRANVAWGGSRGSRAGVVNVGMAEGLNRVRRMWRSGSPWRREICRALSGIFSARTRSVAEGGVAGHRRSRSVLCKGDRACPTGEMSSLTLPFENVDVLSVSWEFFDVEKEQHW